VRVEGEGQVGIQSTGPSLTTNGCSKHSLRDARRQDESSVNLPPMTRAVVAELSRVLNQGLTKLGRRLVADFERVLKERLVLLEPAALPPFDHDGECLILAAILGGVVTLEDLAPLAPKHCLTPWIADAVGALENQSCNIGGVQARLVDLGYPTSAIEELHTVADMTPIVPPEVIRQRALRLVDLWRCRVLGAAYERARSGTFARLLSADEGIALVRAAVVETKQ
jgi:hypothetical protein